MLSNSKDERLKDLAGLASLGQLGCRHWGCYGWRKGHVGVEEAAPRESKRFWFTWTNDCFNVNWEKKKKKHCQYFMGTVNCWDFKVMKCFTWRLRTSLAVSLFHVKCTPKSVCILNPLLCAVDVHLCPTMQCTKEMEELLMAAKLKTTIIKFLSVGLVIAKASIGARVLLPFLLVQLGIWISCTLS